MRLALQSGLSCAVLLIAACAGNTEATSNNCPTGKEHCRCNGNGTCDPGLECRSDLCVAGASGGSTSAGGTTGYGGTTSDGGAIWVPGGTGPINDSGLPAAQDTTDGLYGITSNQANALKSASCVGWSVEPDGGGSAIMEFVMDISSSMVTDSADPSNLNGLNKWTVLSQTMPSVLAALPASFAVGEMYFAAQPNRCYVANANDVPIATNTAAQLQRLQTSLAAVQPNGITPTYQAWYQALQTVTSWQPVASDPPGLANAARYIVLITDGVPTLGRANDCTYLQNSITQSEYDTELGLIQQETTASGVKTFVVGVVGSNNPQNAPFDPLYYLSKIAVVGGTESPPGCVPTSGTVLPNDVQPRGHYCHYDLSASADLSSALAGAVTGIASGLLSCDYVIPPPPAGKTVDPNTTLLVFTDRASGNTSIVLQNTARNCDRGWRFTDSTNTRIKICGTTCNTLQQNPTSSLSLVFGCAAGQIPI